MVVDVLAPDGLRLDFGLEATTLDGGARLAAVEFPMKRMTWGLATLRVMSTRVER